MRGVDGGSVLKRVGGVDVEHGVLLVRGVREVLDLRGGGHAIGLGGPVEGM